MKKILLQNPWKIYSDYEKKPSDFMEKEVQADYLSRLHNLGQ